MRELLSSRVEQFPERTVLYEADRSYTWQEIDQVSDRIKEDLISLGVGRQTHVGICGRNSANWVFTFYAVQKLGALAVLMNPALQAPEIAATLSLSDADIFCYGEMDAMDHEESFLSRVREAKSGPEVTFYSIRNNMSFPRIKRENTKDATQAESVFSEEENAPCVMLFTSGTTGTPKGALYTARNLTLSAIIQADEQRMTEEDKTLLIVPLFHIMGLSACLIPCMLRNASLCIPEDIRTDTLVQTMRRERCTLFLSVPTMLVALMNNPNFKPAFFNSLKCTFIAGAAATEAQLRRFRETLPDNHYLVAYGLSEIAPVSATCYEDTEEHVLHTVGIPVPETEIRILDRESGKDCEMGKRGEILVRGRHLMSGYYINGNEMKGTDDEGWLHTGDLGFLGNDNYLRLSGRYKDLIIRGGENIVPGDIESAITELNVAANVKIVGVPDDFYGEAVCACLLMEENRAFHEASVRESLSLRLARFKLPRYYVVFDQFPMLGTGKIDVTKLREQAMEKLQLRP